MSEIAPFTSVGRKFGSQCFINVRFLHKHLIQQGPGSISLFGLFVFLIKHASAADYVNFLLDRPPICVVTVRLRVIKPEKGGPFTMTLQTNFSVSPRSIASNNLEKVLLSNPPLSILLGGWLGASIALDFLVMPAMYQSGMMLEPGFAAAGMALFATFNHLELLVGAIVLVAVLLRRSYGQDEAHHSLGGWGLPLGLVVIALLDTYWLSPYMSGLAAQLTAFDVTAPPQAMGAMHLLYWGLEAVKLGAIALLLRRTFRAWV